MEDSIAGNMATEYIENDTVVSGSGRNKSMCYSPFSW